MLLDNRTLLFSLVIVYGMMAVSMAFVSRSGERDGLTKWSWALGLETVAWILIAIRGMVPDTVSIVLANLILAAALATKLASIYEYRGLPWSRWQCLLPVLAMMIVVVLLQQDDFRGRILYGSLVYGVQVLIMAYVLWGVEPRSGRAWQLLFISTVAFLPLFLMRAVAALVGTIEFANVQSPIAPNALQLAVFVFVVAQGIVGSIGFVLMIKERTDKESRTLAMTDALTGLYNRRAFMELAEKECTFAERNTLPLGLMMIDVDHFKSINDHYGHAAGDVALASVARILASRLRRQDTIGRYGGEEFCVLLPSTDRSGAASVGEALRRAIERAALSLAKQSISVTVSIGITTYPAQGRSTTPHLLDSLFEKADAALYQAKREGRNRVVMLPEAECTLNPDLECSPVEAR